MRSSSHALRSARIAPDPQYDHADPTLLGPQPVPGPTEPRLIKPVQRGNGHDTEQPLRMYTEEQVAEILQVSLSQLRKWRLKQHKGCRQGPPFRKLGRLVRYPEAALRIYINNESSDPAL